MENQSKPSKSVRILLYFLLASPLPHFVYVYVNVYRAYLAKGAEMWQSNSKDFGLGTENIFLNATLMVYTVGIALASVLLLLSVLLKKGNFGNIIWLYWFIILFSLHYFGSSSVFMWIVD